MRRYLILIVLVFLSLAFSYAFGDDSEIIIEYAGSTLWSHIERACIQDDYAFCASQHGLMIYDIGDLSSPQLVSKFFLETGEGKDIAVSGDYAFLCCNAYGILVFDISDKSNPVNVGHYSEDYWRAEEIVLSEPYIYVLDNSDDVYIFDITVPETPVFVGEYMGIGGIRDMIPRGDYLYCGSSYGLEISNISDPSAPDTTGVEPITDLARATAIYNNFAYILNSSCLYIVDITNPAAPFMIDSVALGFTSHAVRDMFVIGNHLYASNGEYDDYDDDGGVVIFDISIPVAPVIVGHLKMDAWRMCCLGDKIGVTDLEAYYKIMDITDPANPVEAGEFDIPHTRGWGFRGIETDGNYAYIAYGPSDLCVVDIRDPENMIPVTCDLLPGGAYELTLRDNLLYLASGSRDNQGLYIFDVTAPESPLAIGYYPYYNSQEITVSGDYAFMAGNSFTSVILDISNPYSPSFVSDYQVGEITWGIAVKDNYAYLATMRGLVIIDVTDIDSPVVADTISEQYESLYDAIIYEDWLVTAGNYKVKVRDISSPLSPVTVAELPYNSDVNALKAYGNYIFVAAGYNQFDIIDMTTPASPVVVGTETFSGETQDIDFFDGYAYVIDQYGLASYSVDLPACCMVAGDANFDGETNVGDALFLINYIFREGALVDCRGSADANGDCIINIGDPVMLINYIFRAGAAPACSDCVK